MDDNKDAAVAVQEIKELDTEKAKQDPRFELFTEYYWNRSGGHTIVIDEKEKKTYQNATYSAIKAYDLEIPRQRKYAKVLGHRLITRDNQQAREYMEERGLGLPTMIDVAAAKMSTTENPSWWDRLMELAEYKNENKPINQTNVQVNNINFDAPEAKDFDGQFLKFLEQQ